MTTTIICFGFLTTGHSETQSKMASEVTCPSCLETMRGMWVICDQCRLRCDENNAQEFTREHIDHNFTGLRIVKIGNPCPNRARDYGEVANGS